MEMLAPSRRPPLPLAHPPASLPPRAMARCCARRGLPAPRMACCCARRRLPARAARPTPHPPLVARRGALQRDVGDGELGRQAHVLHVALDQGNGCVEHVREHLAVVHFAHVFEEPRVEPRGEGGHFLHCRIQLRGALGDHRRVGGAVGWGAARGLRAGGRAGGRAGRRAGGRLGQAATGQGWCFVTKVASTWQGQVSRQERGGTEPTTGP